MAYIPKVLPGFTYTGQYETELRADWGWIVRFKTSGTLTFTDRNHKIDVFLVGGGGGGSSTWMQTDGGSGGGGGYTATHKNIDVQKGTGYEIVIGAGGVHGGNGVDAYGEASTAFGKTANGGLSAIRADPAAPGSGGSGGGWYEDNGGPGWPGASDGANAAYAREIWGKPRGYGQGSTTREFGMSGWTLYAGGGGGGGASGTPGGAGGAGGGGKGGAGAWSGNGIPAGERGEDGAPNTGGGGGGGGAVDTAAGNAGGTGGSGIVCIRNAADDGIPVVFNGTWLDALYLNGIQAASLVYDGVRVYMRRMKEAMACLSRSTERGCAAKRRPAATS